MMFVIRAAFWMAIVSVFVPKDFAGDVFELPQTVAETRIDAGAGVNAWCADNAELCDAGEEAARLGGFLSEAAIDRIALAIEERDANQS